MNSRENTGSFAARNNFPLTIKHTTITVGSSLPIKTFQTGRDGNKYHRVPSTINHSP